MALREIDTIDAAVTIWSETNTRSFSRADPERRQKQLAARRQVSVRGQERIARGELRWCGTLCPTDAHAQDADLSLAEYEDFVFRACHVLDDDPVGHWRRIGEELRARAEELGGVRELRIVALDAQRSPAEMTVELEVHGCRYIEDRDTTAVLSGNPHTPSVFREHWRLTLDGDDAHPWRIASAT